MIKASKDFSGWDPNALFNGGGDGGSDVVPGMPSLNIKLPTFHETEETTKLVPSSSSAIRPKHNLKSMEAQIFESITREKPSLGIGRSEKERWNGDVEIFAPAKRAAPNHGSEVRPSRRSDNPRSDSVRDMDFAKLMYGGGRGALLRNQAHADHVKDDDR